jgi:hypothetical protein
VARLPHGQLSTLGGTRTRGLRIESPASSAIRPRGHVRLRRQGSNLLFAINSRASYPLDHAGTEKAEAAGLEPANGISAACALATRCLARLGHASRTVASAKPARPLIVGGDKRRLRGRRGSRTPQAAKPTRFRDGIPRLWQSFQVAPAGVEPATARVRAGSSAVVELRSRDVAGRSRTCGGPAFQAGALPG